MNRRTWSLVPLAAAAVLWATWPALPLAGLGVAALAAACLFLLADQRVPALLTFAVAAAGTSVLPAGLESWRPWVLAGLAVIALDLVLRNAGRDARRSLIQSGALVLAVAVAGGLLVAWQPGRDALLSENALPAAVLLAGLGFLLTIPLRTTS